MSNPYVPPGYHVTKKTTTFGIKNWNRRQWSTAMASGIAVVVLSIVSFALIAQALRLDSESANLPARLRVEYASTANSS